MPSLVPVLVGAMALIVSAACPAPASAAGLDTPWLYHPAGRPARVTVTAAGEAGPLKLVMMDPHGNLRAEPIEVEPGGVDLAELFSHLRRMRRASYLQLFADEQPVGAALVLQPMLSRLVPITEEAINPNGIRYTRIVEWRDEVQSDADEPDEATTEPGADAAEDEGDDDAPGTAAPEDPWLANRAEDGRLFSGLRIYPERDVLMQTTHGDIHLAMRPDQAPNTVWNFLRLCEGGFYRDIPFHRIVPMTREGKPFVIQAGDPTPSGSGGPGYWLPMEKSDLLHDFGVISMARDVDPDSAGSQIFICLSRAGTARLDGHYCAFGVAVDGDDTILTIAHEELADVAAGRPVEAPVILGTQLVPGPPRRPGEGRPDRPVRRPLPRPVNEPERVPR